MSRIYLIVIASLLAAMGLLAFQAGVQGKQLKTVIEQRAAVQAQLEQAQTDIAGRDQLLERYRQRSNANAEMAAGQVQTITDINNQLANQRQQMKQLERDNEQLRNWSDNRMPDPVIRMRERKQGITGAAGYRDWLSTRHAVPATGEPAS